MSLSHEAGVHPNSQSGHPGRGMQLKPQSLIHRRAFILLLCCLVATASVQAVVIPLKPGGRSGKVHKEIESLEKQWHTALLADDRSAMADLMAESYIGIGPDGTIRSKSQELQARSSGDDHIQKLDVEDRKIRVYGTTAVVTSKVRIQGIYSGQPLLGQYRYTRVWSLSHGEWRIISFEASRIHDSTARRRS